MGVDLYYSRCVIWDIDQAINRVLLSGNGGANFHAKFSETHQITLKIVLLSFLTLKIWV